MNISTRIILVNTTLPANIGSAARAMKTMGLADLVLVAPKQFPHADATALASGASDILASARIVATLEEAIADCQLVFGTSARNRTINIAQVDAREAGRIAQQQGASGAKVAFVFGREDRGLTNEELQLCHGHVFIPTDSEYGVLNVAAAVQVLCYETRMAHLEALEDGHDPVRDRRESIPGGSRAPSMAHDVAPVVMPILQHQQTPSASTNAAAGDAGTFGSERSEGVDESLAGTLRATDGAQEPAGPDLRRSRTGTHPRPQADLVQMPMTFVPWDEELVSAEDMAGFYAHCEQTLVAVGFLDPDNPRQIMTRLRRLYGRTRLDRPEYNLLRGFFKRVLELSANTSRRAP